MEEELRMLKEQLERLQAERDQVAETAELQRDELAQTQEALDVERENVAHLEGVVTGKNRKLAEWSEEMDATDVKLEEMLTAQAKLIHEKRELVDEIEDLKDDLAQGNADQAHIE